MFTWHKISKDEILFEEGTPGNAFYIVARGCVAVEVAVNKLENVAKEDEAGQVTVLPGQNNDDDNEEGSKSGSKDYDIHEIGIGGIGVQIKNPGTVTCLFCIVLYCWTTGRKKKDFGFFVVVFCFVCILLIKMHKRMMKKKMKQ